MKKLKKDGEILDFIKDNCINDKANAFFDFEYNGKISIIYVLPEMFTKALSQLEVITNRRYSTKRIEATKNTSAKFKIILEEGFHYEEQIMESKFIKKLKKKIKKLEKELKSEIAKRKEAEFEAFKVHLDKTINDLEKSDVVFPFDLMIIVDSKFY